jgi:phage terminase large subunit GpA-like protein
MWIIGTTEAKTAIYDRLTLEGSGPRAQHYSASGGFDQQYFKGLTAEKRKRKFSYGQAFFTFEKDNQSVRNEPLDISVYALAALKTMGVIWWSKVSEALLKTRPADYVEPEKQPEKVFDPKTGKIETEKKPEPAKEQVVPAPAPRPPRPRRQSGWVNRW